MHFKIRVSGINEAKNKLRQYAIEKKDALIGVVEETSKDVQNEARKLAPIDLGELKNRINYTIKVTSKEIVGTVLSAAHYSAYVEFGTRPHMPPYNALRGWSERHGIPTGAVVRKIAREGTPAQPFMNPAAESARGSFMHNVIGVFQ